MIGQSIGVVIPVWRGLLVTAGSGFPPILWFIPVQKHGYGFKFRTLYHPHSTSTHHSHQATFSDTLWHRLQLFSGHSLCPRDTPFIYFWLNFSALRGSFPGVPGGTGSMLGVSQRLAGVGRHAKRLPRWFWIGATKDGAATVCQAVTFTRRWRHLIREQSRKMERSALY